MHKVNFACLFFGYLNRNSHAHEHFTCTGTLPVPVHRYRGILRSLIKRLRSRLRQTANVNLYHVIKFSTYFSFTGAYCFYTKMSTFMPVLCKRIVLDCFYVLIFYSEKFSTDVCRLPYAVNMNLNLSI